MSPDAARFDKPRYSVWLRPDLRLNETFNPLIDHLMDAIHAHVSLRERRDTREGTGIALSVILFSFFVPRDGTR